MNGAVILAAGKGTRFHGDKQNLIPQNSSFNQE